MLGVRLQYDGRTGQDPLVRRFNGTQGGHKREGAAPRARQVHRALKDVGIPTEVSNRARRPLWLNGNRDQVHYWK
jgi:hypothetical protein